MILWLGSDGHTIIETDSTEERREEFQSVVFQFINKEKNYEHC